MDKLRKFFKGFWHEVEPLFNHTSAACCVVLLAAFLVKFLIPYLPEEDIESVKKIDHFLIIGTFWLLAINTLLLLAIRQLDRLTKEGAPVVRRVQGWFGGNNKTRKSTENTQRQLPDTDPTFDPANIRQGRARNKEGVERQEGH